jgi:hypothetical protein
MKKEFKHYYEYHDYCDKISKMIRHFQNKLHESYKINPTITFADPKDCVNYRLFYKTAIERVQKIRSLWVDRHNKKFIKNN